MVDKACQKSSYVLEFREFVTMFRHSYNWSIIALLFVLLCFSCNAEDGEDSADPEEEVIRWNKDMLQRNIDKFESRAKLVNKAESDKILSNDDLFKIYDEMTAICADIKESTSTNPSLAYWFLKAKGIERIIVPNLTTLHLNLRKHLSILIKSLFEIAPATTRAMTPVFFVDSLLEVFEEDDDLAIKAYVLDVLTHWLPDNPKVQARLMKVKGLDPFYHAMTKLDASYVNAVLQLFNKILIEHINVRNEDQINKHDAELKNIYQKIGLIERVSTPAVCHGLLHIIGTAWSYSLNDDKILIPVYELMRNIKPFCLKKYMGKPTAVELFENYQFHLKDLKKYPAEDVDFNVTEIEKVVKEYVDVLKPSVVKEEL